MRCLTWDRRPRRRLRKSTFQWCRRQVLIVTAQVEQDADAPDAAQRQIEEAEGGPLVVVAGPGSGKTRVLTRRIARLVASGVDPGQIMAITFTRRAAGQMRQRLSALLDGGLGAMQVGTFHRLALSLLRELGCEPKLVLDEVEARRLLEGALADAGLSGSVTAASRAISLAKAAAQGPDEVAEEWRPHYDAYQAVLHAHPEPATTTTFSWICCAS